MMCSISGRGQPPVDRDADSAQLGQTESDVEEFGAVALDERHPVPVPDAGVGEGLRRPAGPVIQLAVGDGVVTDDQGRSVGPMPAVAANDVDEGCGSTGFSPLGCIRWRFMIVSTAAGAMLLIAWAVTAIRRRDADRAVRAAVIIQSAASSAVSPGRPS